jgi:cytochrome c-type biogenesis protein CcmE
MSVQPAPQPARRGRKLLIGSVVVVAMVVGLVTWAMARPDSTSFYMTTTEASRLTAAAGTVHEYRVNGRVVGGSIHHKGVKSTFQITDGKTPITVTTTAALPDTFKQGTTIVAQGTYANDRLDATQVLAKCPSKFKPKTTN